MDGIKLTPFEEGFNAKMRGVHIIDNPYFITHGDADKWSEWKDGWHEADKTTDDCENGRGDES